jgi:hypothetical protein
MSAGSGGAVKAFGGGGSCEQAIISATAMPNARTYLMLSWIQFGISYYTSPESKNPALKDDIHFFPGSLIRSGQSR